ncbi:hypothetical protein L2E82_31904 [Cichorium intybus]|uniref:Uncharacterized protein n=1 Tax=Cichorium intybus TaxID=13427 RepID=A0ACB9BFB6_CICIN|nr:hypothetical protein L2E82_31904 [Cichorium intybus]
MFCAAECKPPPPPSHPDLLHDGPGLVLVSQVLTGENYAAWSRSMIIALSVKNKLKFVDGTRQVLMIRSADMEPITHSKPRQ